MKRGGDRIRKAVLLEVITPGGISCRINCRKSRDSSSRTVISLTGDEVEAFLDFIFSPEQKALWQRVVVNTSDRQRPARHLMGESQASHLRTCRLCLGLAESAIPSPFLRCRRDRLGER